MDVTKPTPQWGLLARIIILSLVVGLTAGVIGAISTENYLTQYREQLSQSAERELLLAEEKPRPLPGTFEEAAVTAREVFLPSVVQVYVGADPDTTPLLPSAATGAGVVVTSDGWILTNDTVVPETVLPPSVLVYHGTDAYQVVEIVRDDRSGAVMLDLEVSGLPVVPFGASDDVEQGDLAFLSESTLSLTPTSVVNADLWIASVAEVSAEQFSTAYQLANVPTPGAAVSNSVGELVAIESTPLHHMLPFVRSVIRSGVGGGVVFGATIIDLGFVRTNVDVSRGYDRGATVVQLLEGPALTAGIEPGDILLRIDGVAISRTEPLAELLTNYSPGQTIDVSLDRSGEELTVEVLLGEST